MTPTIYADCNATWPVDAEHCNGVMQQILAGDGNPSSIHGAGREAKVSLEKARGQLATLLKIRPEHLTFTSGATESNNLILQGVVGRQQGSGQRPHILVSAIEHPAVIDVGKLLAERGLCDLGIVPVNSTGQVDVEEMTAMIRPETCLVSIMHANNEVGCINDISALAEATKSKNSNAHFHSDMVQSLSKCGLDWLAQSKVDSAAFSAHKIGGFKGIGALYLRSGIKLNLLQAGGGQERGKRPGTENLPGIYSFGLRAELFAKSDSVDFWQETASMKARLIELCQQIEGFTCHGEPASSLPNTLNFHVEGVAGDDLLLNLDLNGIQASSGSACSSGAGRPSHVLTALGYSDTAALNSIRLSFLPTYPDQGQVADRIHAVLKETVQRVRS